MDSTSKILYGSIVREHTYHACKHISVTIPPSFTVNNYPYAFMYAFKLT